MNNKIIACFIAILLILSVSGCSSVLARPNSNGNNDGNNNVVTPTPQVSTGPSQRDIARANYDTAMSLALMDQQALNSYIQNTKPSTLSDYENYVNNINQKITVYDQTCRDAIAAGNTYKLYLDVGSAEYNLVANDISTLTSSINTYRSAYDTALNELNTLRAMTAAANDYVNKINLVNSTMNKYNSYIESGGLLSGLNEEWVDGLEKIVDEFDSRADDAIASGHIYQQYVTPGTKNYQTVADNEVALNSWKNLMRTNYNEIRSDYQSIWFIFSIGKFVIPFLI